jgi:hypothetical protein
MARSFGLAQAIDDDFRGPKHLFAVAITSLENVHHDVVRLRRVVYHPERLVAVRVKVLTATLFGLDAMSAEELLQLLKRYLHTLAKLVSRCTAGQRPLKAVYDREQITDESLLLRRRTPVGLLRGALAVVFKVGGQSEVSVLLCRELSLLCVRHFAG